VSRYRGYRRRSYRQHWGARHVSERQLLSHAIGGLDHDIEKAFLSLPLEKLEGIFRKYGASYGKSAETYARTTHLKWKAGTVRMSGKVAERLINLVPPVLDHGTRFELVKKLRTAFFRKRHTSITCEPQNWRAAVAPVVADLVSASAAFELPPGVREKLTWLAAGDVRAGQALLAAAEQEEAADRLRYLEAEFRRIDMLIEKIEATRWVSHTIELPQGSIAITIKLPEKGVWAWLASAFK
jgi:hypothetical protein